jgi:hypothetical protein
LVNGVVQDCEFSDYTGDVINCCFKLYATDTLLIEDCDFHDLDISDEDEEAIANKAGNTATTVRGCTSSTMDQGTYGGNQNAAATGNCDAELCFNYFQTSDHATLLMNHDNTSNAATRIHRCTFRGTTKWDELQTANGPYTMDRCVIVNGNAATDNPDGTGITHNIAPQDISRLTVTNHLFGPNDGSIIDSDGLLTGAYRTSYLNSRGHEIALIESNDARIVIGPA